MKAATRSTGGERIPGGISIHAAREGGDRTARYEHDTEEISIHAAREGGDPAIEPIAVPASISIHAAREGGDSFLTERKCNLSYFNPRRP